MKIYPAIDLMNGCCVRLRQGSFSAISRYSDDPVQVAQRFFALGAKYLHIVDLDGARAGEAVQFEVISRILKSTEAYVQVGGGIRTLAHAQRLLDVGVSSIVLGSIAVKDPVTTRDIIERIGSERVTLAVDFKRSPNGDLLVAVNGWSDTAHVTVTELINNYQDLGVKSLLCTDISRDGMLSGPDVSVYRSLQQDFPACEIQVSGGISAINDLVNLKTAGLRAAILGKSLYEGRIDLEAAISLC
jgi:phosphoribosylformimino-5-aminoimidazole carboxamide ribotide isomerase